MTTKRRHEKRPTETVGVCELNMAKVPFQPVALALTDVGMEIFLRLEDKTVLADDATQQVKSQGAIKPGGLKMTSNQTNNAAMLSPNSYPNNKKNQHLRFTNNAAMLSPNSYPNNKKNQHLRFDKNVQAVNRWMEDCSEDMNYMDYKFSGAGDNLAIGKSLHQTSTMNDERYLRHVERVENTEAPLWDFRRMATDRFVNPDTGSNNIGDFRVNIEDDSDDTTDVDSDFEVRNFHEWLARRRIMEKLAVERNLLKTLSSRTAADSHDYGMPIWDHCECSCPLKGQNNDRMSVSETKKYEEGNVDLANDLFEKRNSNLAKQRYDGLFGDQWTESGYKYRSNSLAVDGCTCPNLCNEISPPRQTEKQVKYGDACASHYVGFNQRGPGGTCHGYQTTALDNVNHKTSPTGGTLRKSTHFDAVSPDHDRQDNAEPMGNNKDGCMASTEVRHANNCTTCNEDEDRKACNAYNGSEDLSDPKVVDNSDPQNSQSTFNLADLPEESRNKAAVAKIKEYSHNMKKEIRISRAKMNNLVKQFKRLQAKNRPEISDSSSTITGEDEGSYSSWCPIL